MPKIIVLLDVDDTAVMSNMLYGEHNGGYRYHTPLLNALKRKQLLDIYLFTSYDLAGVARNIEEEPTGNTSRLKLSRYLESLGFRVHGVITKFDPIYNRGIGGYYAEVIRPFEEFVLQGINLRKEKKQEFEALCKKEIELREKAGESFREKGPAFRYVANVLPLEWFYPEYAFIMVDDQLGNLQDVKKHNDIHQYPLHLMRSHPMTTEEEYSESLNKFLTSLENSRVKKDIIILDDSLSQKISLPISRDIALDPLQAKLDEILLSFKEPNLESLDEPKALVYGLGEPFFISYATAMAILSKDSKGCDDKKNVNGRSIVTPKPIRSVYFKRDPEYYLNEQAVYQMSRRLGGHLVTPTRLLFLKLKEGLFPVQASLAVEGYSLADILRIPGSLLQLQNIFEEEINEVLPKLISGEYYESWLKRQRKETLELSWEAQAKLLLDILYRLPTHQQPLELTKDSPSRQVVETQLLKNDALRQPLFCLIALLENYPVLGEASYLIDLIHLPRIFEVLRTLFEGESVQTIIKEGQEILNRFDAENVGRHLLLALLMEPGDQKGENFIVEVNRDEHKNIASLEIVGIDNDDAMQGTFKGKSNEVNVKTVIYRLLKNVHLSSALRKLFLSIKPEVFIVEWLCDLIRGFPRYAEMIQSGVIFKGMVPILHLKEQLPIQFIARTLKRLQGIQAVLSKKEVISLEEIFYSIEPLLAKYYEVVGERYSDAQTFIMKLYDGREDAKTILDAKSLSEVERASFYCQSYEECLQEFLQTSKVLEPSLIQKDILMSLATLVKYPSLVAVFNRLDIVIPPEVCVELYLNFTDTIIPLFTSFNTVWLPLGGRMKGDIKNEPEILFYAMSHASGEILVKILLCLGASIKPRRQDGFTALHFAASFCPECVTSLIPFISVESVDRDNNTPLDLAVMHRNEKAVQTLILAQAGERIKLANARIIIQQYLEKFPELCEALLVRHLPLAWELSLESLSQVSKTKEDVAFAGLEGKRYLTSDAYRQIFECNLYVMPELKLPLRRNALILVADKAYFVKDRAFVMNGKELKSLAVLSPKFSEINEDGLVLLNDELRQYIQTTLKKAGVSFKDAFPKDNIYGCRSITQLQAKFSSTINFSIHLKENPEFAVREMMVHHFAKNLLGFITPHIALCRFSKERGYWWQKEKKTYPVLAMRTIEGITLRDTLLKHPERMNEIDSYSLSAAIILAMLINPEDGRGDNYMVESYKKGDKICYRVVSIDNDRSFVRPILLKRNGEEETHVKSLQVKTILYCLEQMQDIIHPEVVEKLLKIKPYEFLREWLDNLEVEQSKVQGLFDDKERQELIANGIHLEHNFKPSIVLDIYQKLNRLQALLKKDPHLTHFEILRQVIPNLAIRYRRAFEQAPTPIERFKILTEKSFETRVIKIGEGKETHEISTSTTTQVLEMTGDLRAEELKLEEEKAVSLKLVAEKLKEIHELKLREIRDELQKGITERFLKLPLSDYQEQIFNGAGAELPGIDFSVSSRIKMPMSTIIKINLGLSAETGNILNDGLEIPNTFLILNSLVGLSFRKLKFHHVTITEKGLDRILISHNALLALSIENCSQFTQAAISIIAKRCIHLEKLRLVGFETLDVGINFPSLKELKVRNCKNLKEWSHQGSGLKRLTFRDCPQLTTLRIADASKLEYLQLKGCNVPYSSFYEKYPKMLMVSLAGFPEGFASQFIEVFEKSFAGNSMKNNLLSFEFINSLDEILALWKKGFDELYLKLLKIVQNDNAAIEEIAELVILNPDIKTLKMAIEKLLLLSKDVNIGIEYDITNINSILEGFLVGESLQNADTLNDALKVLLPLLIRREIVFNRRFASIIIRKLCHTPEASKLVIDALLSLLEEPLNSPFSVKKRVEVAILICELTDNPEIFKLALEALIKLITSDGRVDGIMIESAARAIGKLSYSPETFKISLGIILSLFEREDTLFNGTYLMGVEFADIAIKEMYYTSETWRVALGAFLLLLTNKSSKYFPTIICIANAIGKLPHTPETLTLTLKILFPLLEHKNPLVRSNIAIIIGKFPHNLETINITFKALSKLLTDDLEVRECVAFAIGSLPHTTKTYYVAQEALLRLPKTENEFAGITAKIAIARLNTISGFEDLLTLLRDSSAEHKHLIITAIGELAFTAKTIENAFKALLSLVKEKNSLIRKSAITGIKNIMNLSHDFETIKVMMNFLLNLDLYELKLNKINEFFQTNVFLKHLHGWLTSQFAQVKIQSRDHSKSAVPNTSSKLPHAKSQNIILNVSAMGNNCGLFALALGTKRSLSNSTNNINFERAMDPELLSKLKSIREVDLQRHTEKTKEVGESLRKMLVEVLSKDKQFIEGRYQHFIELAVSFCQGRQLPIDLEAVYKANLELLNKLKLEWKEVEKELSQFSLEEAIKEFEFEINPEQIQTFTKKIKELLLGMTESNSQERIEKLMKENFESQNIPFLKKLFQYAWAEIQQEDASPEERRLFNAGFEKWLQERMIEFIRNQKTEKEQNQSLFKCAMLQRISFLPDGKVKMAPRQLRDILPECIMLFSIFRLKDEWKNVYERYLNYVQQSDVFLSADELGALANHWRVQLSIRFNEYRPPYHNFVSLDNNLLHVTLCNPSRVHWMVEETSAVMAGEDPGILTPTLRDVEISPLQSSAVDPKEQSVRQEPLYYYEAKRSKKLPEVEKQLSPMSSSREHKQKV